MYSTYQIRIKKDYAASVIEELVKMEAIELTQHDQIVVPAWQKEELKKSASEIVQNDQMMMD